MQEKRVEYGRNAYVTSTCHMRETWESKPGMRSEYEK